MIDLRWRATACVVTIQSHPVTSAIRPLSKTYDVRYTICCNFIRSDLIDSSREAPPTEELKTVTISWHARGQTGSIKRIKKYNDSPQEARRLSYFSAQHHWDFSFFVSPRPRGPPVDFYMLPKLATRSWGCGRLLEIDGRHTHVEFYSWLMGLIRMSTVHILYADDCNSWTLHGYVPFVDVHCPFCPAEGEMYGVQCRRSTCRQI